MARPTKPLILSAHQEAYLQTLVRSRQLPHSVVQRAQIVLQAAAGRPNNAIAAGLGLSEDTVGFWRRRWLDNSADLAPLEEQPKPLATAIDALLADQARPGSPGTFSAEQVCRIIALACETPPSYLSHWTHGELAREAVKRHIVTAISPATIRRFLKSGGS
jgi:transposase